MMREWEGESIVILDFGSQYTQLIARRIRADEVFSVILPHSAGIEEILAEKPKGLILSGGPADLTEENAPRLKADIFSLGIPVLGICYGMQLISQMKGAELEKTGHREFGHTKIEANTGTALFRGTPAEQKVWMSHGVRLKSMPEGFVTTASSPGCPIAAMNNDAEKIYGLQFHPEVFHTENGIEILQNFLFEVCGCEKVWSSKSFVDLEVSRIRKKVGDARVLCAVSGGVDSSVMAALVDRAIGKQLVPVFVDNGLLRENEAEEVQEILAGCLMTDLVFVDATDEFLEKLEGVTDPEKKRKIIGKTFIDVFERESEKRGPFAFLAQGTLYPDVIESRSTVGPSDMIKSHHNVGGLPEDMSFELIEPLSLLFKDEVREVGRFLELPAIQIERHPFPGPGLAVRVPGAITRNDLDLLRKVDKIFIDGLKRYGLYNEVWQAFAVLLPVRSVGVMGDERTYQKAATLRAVTSTDGMTADWARLPYDFLQDISNEIINRVDGVNRVVYDISSKPPSTIEWE
ncbi:MAG: glutamine-hydrolyzing GMP synthase [Candidatus Krumholzibacteria bacterium]|nr:glutamine-hydrolyzing GMP synthase [Candidatus Krumholzibacteria bacterium]